MDTARNLLAPIPGRRPSRRSLLKVAAGSAVAAGAGAVGLGAASAAAADGTPGYDAIVIGAGFAGVTAARELQANGLRTLLVEARNRIGGRTWTSTFLGKQVEFGGTWIDEIQVNVWREAQRYRIPIVSDTDPMDRAIYPGPEGVATYTPDEVFAREATLLGKVMEGTEGFFPRPYEPFFNQAGLIEPDKLSLRDRLDQLRLSEEDDRWVSAITGGYSGGSSTYGAYTMLAHWWALSGRNYGGFMGVNVDRPATGMKGLLQAMLDDAKLSGFQLSTPVSRIENTNAGVQITTRAGQRISAKVAVVALPANVWKNINFGTAGLPSEFLTLSKEGMAVQSAQKIYMQLRGANIGRFVAQAPEGYKLVSMLTQHILPDGQIAVGFSADPTLDGNNLEQVRAAVRQLDPTLNVVSVKAQHWGRDEFSLGGWTFRRPGQLTTKLRAVQQPVGRLTFATSDIATGWAGYVDGAVESGFRAAKQALELARRVAV
ncbi:flavin monoamine oxidase family protein [Streptomyces sp. NPDC090127]|uniref:flavin monoamine oxidase family protein n=1 Tax=Streptomyces sp. NPDC090127 TaxID=3365953 RepID=UPI00381F3270